jgi:hypothetical protein
MMSTNQRRARTPSTGETTRRRPNAVSCIGRRISLWPASVFANDPRANSVSRACQLLRARARPIVRPKARTAEPASPSRTASGLGDQNPMAATAMAEQHSSATRATKNRCPFGFAVQLLSWKLVSEVGPRIAARLAPANASISAAPASAAHRVWRRTGRAQTATRATSSAMRTTAEV